MKRLQLVGKAQKTEDDVYSVMASTPDVDRSGDVILPKAYKASLKAYLKKNPVILWMHQHDQPPIGKAVAGEILKDGLQIDFKFADTPQAQQIRYLFDEGFLNAVSVGLLPKEAIWDPDEVRRVLDREKVEYDADHPPVRVFTDAELLEVSAVTVPANANALLVRALEQKFGDAAITPVDEKSDPGTLEEDDADESETPEADASHRPDGAVLSDADRIRAFAKAAVERETT